MPDIIAGKSLIKDGFFLNRSMANWTNDVGHVTFRNDSVMGVVARITCTDATLRAIRQSDTFPIGTRIRGWARGDGTIYPNAQFVGSGELEFTGSTSTTWQRIDVVSTGAGTGFSLQTGGAEAAGRWVEFAQIEVIAPGYPAAERGNSLAVEGWISSGTYPSTITQISVPGLGTGIRVTRTEAIKPYNAATQAIAAGVAHRRYRAWVRGDGTSNPVVTLAGSGTTEFIGTSSTAWQRAEFTSEATCNGTVFFNTVGGGIGNWCEFVGVEMIVDAYLIQTRPNLLADGFFLTRSTAAWTGDTGHVTFRNDDAMGVVARITCDSAVARYIRQLDTFPAGTRLRCWVRGNGTLRPRVKYTAADILFDGTSSLVWQRVDALFPGVGTNVLLASIGGGAGAWVEFAQIEVYTP